MSGRTSIRGQRFGSLGFSKSANVADKKQELQARYEPIAAQQENINANTPSKVREPMRNLMFDPRVVRGSQFLHKSKPPDDVPVPRRNYAPWRTKKPGIVQYSVSPAPIQSRKHCDIQTDVYLEELVDKIPDFDAVTQTDQFLDRPSTPLFIPWKSGPDKWTQIYEGDLFHFDLEVEAMLEVLCGRTIEQAIMEVMEDHQLAHIRMHQDRFEQLRITEMVAAEQLEAAHKRAIDEKERRKEQERKRLMEEKKLHERLEAEVFTKHYIHDLKEEVMENLRRKGWFFDPRQREIETLFVPLMLEGVWSNIEDIVRSRFALSYMVGDIILPVAKVSSENVIEEGSEDLDMVLDHIDDIIEAEDICEEVINIMAETSQSLGPVMKNIEDARDMQLEDQTRTKETIPGTINLAQKARNLVDKMLQQFRPQNPIM